MQRLGILWSFVAISFLAGCSESNHAANYSASAVVSEAKKTDHWNKAYGSGYTIYDLKLEDSSPPELKYLSISGSSIKEEDVSSVVGKRVSTYVNKPHGRLDMQS